MTTVYDESWQDFARGEHILRAGRGEGIGLVLLVWLQERQIAERMAELQRAVADVVPMDPIPRDALHITVRYLGEVTDHPEKATELHPDRLPETITSLFDLKLHLLAFAKASKFHSLNIVATEEEVFFTLCFNETISLVN